MSLYNELERRNVLRVVAAYVVVSWLVIQVVETVFPAFGFGDAAVRSVTIVLAIGLIPTLILSWAFEITPEGLKKEKDVDRSQSISAHTGKKLDRMIMVVLALALGFFAIDKFVLSEPREASIAEEARQEGRSEALVESYGDKSIAVLPFVNMSDDASNEYFSDGISEELLNLLAKIPELRVISRTSAFSYKGKQIKLTEVARELNVTHILEGSVRKAGNQVRITAQLIEARSDTHLWSETYDRTLDDIFSVQDEIASVVVEKLRVTILGDPPKVEEANPDAYAFVLHASHLNGQQTPDGTEQALFFVKKALAIDRNYARAWTELARTYTYQVFYDQRSIEDSKILAAEALDHALTINPEFVAAHRLLGDIAINYENDLSAAARHYQRAMELDPSDKFYTRFLFELGRLDEAIVLQEELVSRDPVNSNMYHNLGASYTGKGYLDKALASYRTALQLNPGRVGTNFRIGIALLLKNEPQAALAAFTEEPDEIYRIKGRALALHDLGRKSEFEAAMSELQERWGERWPSEIAMVFAWIGDKDAAFQWLEKEIEVNGTYGWTSIPQDPQFQNLYEDPRWQALLTRVGVSANQLADIEFTVTLPE